MVVEAGTGPPASHSPPFVLTLQKVKRAPSSLLWKISSLRVRWAEWEGSPHFKDKETGPKRQSCFTGVKSPAALAWGHHKAGRLPLSQAVQGEGSTRVGNLAGGGVDEGGYHQPF